jgi:hypothetical protein
MCYQIVASFVFQSVQPPVQMHRDVVEAVAYGAVSKMANVDSNGPTTGSIYIVHLV